MQRCIQLCQMTNIFIHGVEPSATATVGLVFSFVLNNDNTQLRGPNRRTVVLPTYDSEKVLEPLIFISDGKRSIGG
jgi:hypothetical protein